MKKKNNNNRNEYIYGLTMMLTVGVLSMGYLVNENISLKDQLSASIEASVERTETKAEPVKAKEVKPTKTAELPTEDALLANLFPEIAELQEKSENPDTNSEVHLVISPEVYDFGTISKANGPVTAVYELTNEGENIITLSYAFASCGCTASSLKEDVELAPGQTYPLEIAYDPNFYGPNFELGEISKTVTVLSNDPVKPFYKVKLKATVTP